MNHIDVLIKSKIHTIRGVQVMLDGDLAELYSVEVKALNQAVKRNTERFPGDFMFRLSDFEFEFLRSQIVTANIGWSKKRFLLAKDKFNQQHGSLEIVRFEDSHDRFMIIDEDDVYHIGASLKDLGKKWFAFSKLGLKPKIILSRLTD